MASGAIEATPPIADALARDLDEVASACRILHQQGHADMILGHLSLRDPDGRGVWLKRSGIGLGEVRDFSDFVLIDFDGRRLAGDGRLHKEWPLHTEILRARSDINVVGHSHPFHATAFSALNVELRAVTNEAAYLGPRVPRFNDTTALIDTPQLGAALSRALGDASSVLMRNHGIAFVGRSIAACTLTGVFLERACRSQLTLLATGLPYAATSAAEIATKQAQILDNTLLATFWAFYRRGLHPIDTSQHHTNL
ncbi:MAG: class II aldolase/adducin family protein [Pseudomonadota bacterium]